MSARTDAAGRGFDLLVVGELNPDVIVLQPGLVPAFGQVEILVEEIRLEIGSSSAIVACGAARLGLRVAFVGVVGADPFGRFMLGGLADRGVDVSHCRVDPVKPTGATVILSRGVDRAILTAPGTMEELTVDDVPHGLLRRTRHVHVGSMFLQPALANGLASLFRSARQAGATTSLDTNWDPSGDWGDPLRDVLAETDLFLPNLAELAAISGESDQDTGVRKVLAHLASGATLGVKSGAAGGFAARAAERASVSALAGPVVDTTGAGDSFDAGMIAGLLDHASLEASLRLAVACGSLSVRGVGGTASQPSLIDALAAAERLRPAIGSGKSRGPSRP